MNEIFNVVEKHHHGAESTLSNMKLLYPSKQGYSFIKGGDGDDLVKYEIQRDGKIIGFFYPDVMVVKEKHFYPCADITGRWQSRSLRVAEEFDKGKWVYCSAVDV